MILAEALGPLLLLPENSTLLQVVTGRLLHFSGKKNSPGFGRRYAVQSRGKAFAGDFPGRGIWFWKDCWKSCTKSVEIERFPRFLYSQRAQPSGLPPGRPSPPGPRLTAAQSIGCAVDFSRNSTKNLTSIYKYGIFVSRKTERGITNEYQLCF